jgi:hypothetical protein
VRPNRMRATRTAAILAVLVTSAACGQQPGSTSVASRAGYGACADKGTVAARADLDGDGTVETVRLVTGGTGGCADSLIARMGPAVAGTSVTGLGLVAARARTVHLKGPGAPDLVLLPGAPHRRGGAQMHLFGARSDRLAEVTAAGEPVLPFVATDGGSAPMTATCRAHGGIAVWTGTAHQPPGIVLAWDVERTTYDIRNGSAVHPRTTTIVRAAADPLLRKQRPELFAGRLFADCS